MYKHNNNNDDNNGNMLVIIMVADNLDRNGHYWKSDREFFINHLNVRSVTGLDHEGDTKNWFV